MVLVATVFAVASKNPDTRYQPMRDDRGSFIKSQTQLNTELDALGATARGDMAQKGSYFSRDLDEDSNSFSSDGKALGGGGTGTPMSGVAGEKGGMMMDPYHQNLPSSGAGGRQDMPLMPPSAPYGAGGNHSGHGSSNSISSFRAQNNSSPWQRGAGYDH